MAAVLLMGSASSLTVALLGRKAEASPQEIAMETVSLEETSGKIGVIDGEHQLITVEHKGRATRLQVNQSTTIFISGRTGSLADLSKGQRVRATFEGGAQLPVAEWIELSDVP